MTATMPPSATDQKKLDSMSSMRVFGLAGEIGYLIAIPAAIFGFGGAYLDKYMRTSPLFVIAGLMVALASSMLAIWYRIKPLLES